MKIFAVAGFSVVFTVSVASAQQFAMTVGILDQLSGIPLI
jgi:hypothetical protein